MSLDRGFQIMNPELSHWAVLLPEWCDCFEKFCNYSQTVPAINKEETSVGILAGAAWRINWVGFQEMRRMRNGSGNIFNRICDLYLCNNLASIDDYLECKHTRGDVNNVVIAMKKVCNEVENLILDDASDHVKRIGVVFANFEFLKTIVRDQDMINNSIRDRLEAIKTMTFDALAWSFPQSMRNYEDDGKIFPGTVLLAKFVGNKEVVAR
jgi:hypothetical protein